LEISDDGRYLYSVNLYDKKLYEIDLTKPKEPIAPVVSNAKRRLEASISRNPCITPESGEARPFGLKVRKNRLYVKLLHVVDRTYRGDVVARNKFRYQRGDI